MEARIFGWYIMIASRVRPGVMQIRLRRFFWFGRKPRAAHVLGSRIRQPVSTRRHTGNGSGMPGKPVRMAADFGRKQGVIKL